MAETVDVQSETIGVGTVAAFALYGYGTFVDDTLFGYDARTLGMLAFAVTFAALAILHGAYGRRDFAAANAVAALGLGLFLLSPSGVLMILGFFMLIAGGAVIAVVTLRARRTESDTEDVA